LASPAGHVVIGNFDVANPTRAFMELILDWPLRHRSAGDLAQARMNWHPRRAQL
jgi:hypothetical protein